MSNPSWPMPAACPASRAVRRALALLAAACALLGARTADAQSEVGAPAGTPRPAGTTVAASAAGTADTGQEAESARPVAAGRATATLAEARRAVRAPTVDGRDDDAVWRDAQVIDQFLEYEPTQGATPRFRTEVRVLFDDRYLYVVARMHDPAPDSIVSLLSRRDVRTQSEQLKLVVDSYHDRRTAYQFILNPAGVKRDYYVYNDNVEDVTWDAVWDGASRVDSLGWVAEFRIPLSQLRFPKRERHTFGLLVVRDVQRTGQRISWPLFRRDRQGYVSQAGELTGFAGFDTPRRLEVTPYAVTKNVTLARPGAAGAPTRYAHPQQQAFGADVKYGVTSNLTLDATINPDFGQVEADPAVLNLSAFEQFFEERRPFFLEGAGIFTFRNSCNDIDTGCRGLFYSRRIGRSPQLGGAYGDASSPLNTTILGAAKLTGRTPRGLSVGVLDAVTQREQGTLARTIEPATNYFVARAQQDLRDGQGDVGVMLTAVNRGLDSLGATSLRRAAYTGGIDFRRRFLKRNYELHASLSGSVVQGSASAITLLQRDGVHRFQRPDDGLALDPTRTRLVGDAQRLSISKFGGGVTRFQSVYQRYSPGFEINDLGFQPRADEQLFRNWFSFQLQKPTRYYRRAFLNFNAHGTWTAAGLHTSNGLNTNQHVELPNLHWLHWGVNANGLGAAYDDRDARGGPAVRRALGWETWAGWEGDRRRNWTPTFFAGVFGGDAGRSRGVWIDPGVQLRLTSRFSTSLTANYNRSRNDNQWVGNYGVAGVDTTHYTFARLDQRTLGLTTRINLTASPTLSLQVYAQPFLSVGDYSDWRELADPRAARYADRYRPYGEGRDPGGLDFKQLRTNTVLRWEYRPGSTLFVVWAHGRDAFTDRPTRELDVRRQYGDLFALPPNNTFLVKLSYWLNP